MTKEEIEASLDDYEAQLFKEELKVRTIRQYLRDIKCFLVLLEGEEPISKESVIQYKMILESRLKPSSVNSKIISINRYLKWLGCQDLTVKTLKIQRQSSLNHVLEQGDYEKILRYADNHGCQKYYHIMKTLAGTGIRVGELKYITCQALKDQVAIINHKGKIREICIPEKLCSRLLKYCGEQGIREGIIFHGRSKDKPLDPSGIWKYMKRMAAAAKVDPDRVYPHSFRHLFAKTFMRQIGNLTELSDILGHSNIETTRIYTMETTAEKLASLDRLNL